MSSFTVGASTICYVGYELPVALDHLAAAGYRYVEVAAVEGGLNHLSQEDLTPPNAAKITSQMARLGLSANAVSAHSPLTRPDAVERFGTRIRFAADLGSPVCVTTTGPRSDREALKRNLPELLKVAEECKVRITVETNADIVTTAQDGLDLIEEYSSPWLGLNYDPANVYRGTNGEIEPVADFRKIVDTVNHVHVKDIGCDGDGWKFRGPGAGILDMDGFVACLAGRTKPVGVNLELPYLLRLNVLNGPISILTDRPELDIIDRDVQGIRLWIEAKLGQNQAAA